MLNCKTDLEKVNALNKLFSSVFNQNTECEIIDDLVFDVKEAIKPLTIDQNDILKRLQKLNINKSAGK